MSVGAKLQQARNERRLSLADVTKATKIQTWVLETLESDQLQDQMSPVYVRGFLTTYAKFLHVDPEPLVAQLLSPPVVEAAREPQRPAATQEIPAAVHWELPMPLIRRVASALAVGTAVAGLIIVNPLRWLPHLTMPKMTMPKMASVAPPIRVRPSAAIVKPPAPATVPVLPSEPLELHVRADRTTWIQVKADGKLLSQQRLLRGADEQWTARRRFEVVIAQPSMVEVTLNGQPISSVAIAHRGRLLITHQGIAALPNPE